jgi:hypothetical protein
MVGQTAMIIDGNNDIMFKQTMIMIMRRMYDWLNRIPSGKLT